MLNHESLDNFVDSSRLLQLYEQLELDILEDMARRVKDVDMLTTSEAYQASKLKAMGATEAYIKREIKAIQEQSDKLAAELVEEGVSVAYQDESALHKAGGVTLPSLTESSSMGGIVESQLLQTQGTLQNITGTTAKLARAEFGSVMDRIHLQVSSGAFSYDQAVKNGMSYLANMGVYAVEYPSGRKDSLYTATRRALITSVNQASNKVQDQLQADSGSDLVEVTAHTGARSNGKQDASDHAWWQGKVYSVSGKSKKYPPLSVTGYGSVVGLAGANCRHSKFTWYEGTPLNYTAKQLQQMAEQTVTYQGKHLTVAEALEKQRSLERNVRKWKKADACNKAARVDAATSSAKVKAWQKELRGFTKETGLSRQYVREGAF